ncbi:MAG: S8 family serine peptidase [Polyangiaceae bacterium]|nr:S8 family serine peptidase [Polyangiaceae bacterium]
MWHPHATVRVARPIPSHAAPMKRAPRVLPIAERLRADTHLAGRNVTLAFLDSGFYAHPDLTTPHDRIIAYYDVTNTEWRKDVLHGNDASAWHGMMTSVVAAGNGSLSKGKYKGLAYESSLVLVKVGQARRIHHDDIRRGLEWVTENRHHHNIRVVNISCGGDYEESYLTDGLCRAADDAVRAGLFIVAAVGNAGHDPSHPVLPPASAPSVLAVGGFNDGGHGEGAEGYHSSYGPTIDGLQKPELIAPSILVAAPILPNTPTASQARLYSMLDEAEDDRLHAILSDHPGIDGELDSVRDRDSYLIRQLVAAKGHEGKVLSGHYKHVDGTSFAAPIVASVAAQMFEANPRLRPQEVKQILCATARRLPGIAAERQGFGCVQPRAAVDAARSRAH